MHHPLTRCAALLLLALAVCLPGPARAADDGAGTSSATFLKIIPYPSGAAMSAYTAVATGNEALFFNPAGLAADTPTYEVTMVHNDWLGLADYEYLAASMPVAVGAGGGLGVSLSYLSTGDIMRTTVSDPNGLSSGDFDASDLMLTVGYGQKITEFVQVGGNFNYLREQLYTYRDSVLAFDAGVRVLPMQGLVLGASVHSLGQDLKFVDRADDLPTTWRFGAAYTWPAFANDMTVAIDGIKPNDEDLYGALGLSYDLGDYAVVRAGYSTKKDIGSGFTAGVGLGDGEQWMVDYSYTPYGKLGTTNRVSLSFRY